VLKDKVVSVLKRKTGTVCYLLAMVNCQSSDRKISAHLSLGEISKKHACGHFFSALVVPEELLGDIALRKRL